MDVLSSETIRIRTSDDIVIVRQAVRRHAIAIGLNLVEQTKIVTASSELARNALYYGKGGEATVAVVRGGVRKGVRIDFVDCGPGIPDINAAMQDGFTTAGGLGLGLGGAKRLSNEFEIESKVGVGTRVSIVRWKG